MVPLAVSSMFFHEYTTAEIFLYVSRAGLDGIEYWIETPHFWLRDLPVHEVVTEHKKHLEIATLTVHAPILDLNPCSINPDVADVSLAYAARSIEMAGQMGARVLTLHPGRRTAKRPPGEADFARFSRYIAVVRETALKDTIKVSMENMEPKVNSLLCSPERMRKLLDDEPWLYFTLDVAHALAKDEEEPLRYIDLCGDRLANIHISRKEGKALHLPLDRSPLMGRVMKALLDIGYGGPLTLEIDDLNFVSPLSAEEKIAILTRDRVFMQECME
ncbi:sugar phosphate isomerase/epimerase [Methanoregula sp.]|uniref:sugar phosphate isomerase/epimerase family protein n=1 Tax=Methanoregula sp. TaxID=2052170 RepID=UPI000CB72F83|nr:sugar phosphate isomerase/epimerase family protein [Methanoregula sp.]PKG33965.1 MAG: sugar phosphate isomerase/epimerase [Methanoregula sp.]